MNSTARAWALACAAFYCSAQAQSVHHVPGDFATIQSAIDASSNGDTVLVDPGTYFECIDVTHDIAIVSTSGPEVTIIDGGSLGSVVTTHSFATAATRIEGFTITHGRNGFSAGGVYADSGSPWIVGNVITENSGGGEGSGIFLYASAGHVIGNKITFNGVDAGVVGGGGGGVAVGADPCSGEDCGTEIRNNYIAFNYVSSYEAGGGIYLNASGNVAIVANVILGNTVSNEGGGIAVFNGSRPRIENNLIVQNQTLSTSSQGGGVYWSSPQDGGGSLVGNTLVGNGAVSGSAIYGSAYRSTYNIVNNMIVGAPGSTGVECASFAPVVRNNDVYVAGGAAAFAGVCAGEAGVDGNIAAQPIFLNADFQLAPRSPGIDAGDDSFVTESTDLRGQRRIVDANRDGSAVVDIGAYERPDLLLVNPPPARH